MTVTISDVTFEVERINESDYDSAANGNTRNLTNMLSITFKNSKFDDVRNALKSSKFNGSLKIHTDWGDEDVTGYPEIINIQREITDTMNVVRAELGKFAEVATTEE
jgi:hypothetical protein